MKFQPGLLIIILFVFITHISHAQNWEALNPPINIFNGTIQTSTLDAEGNLYAAGDFKNNNFSQFVAKWNGTNWNEMGSGISALNANNTILTLASYGNTIYAAGGFTNKYSQAYVAKWNGSSWTELDNNDTSLHANGLIYSVAVDKAGNVYAAGNFTNTAGNYYVAEWNGTTWSELGSGSNALNANNAIFTITTDEAGNVYAGGYFTNASGKEYVAKWNGTLWSELGSGSTALNSNDIIRCIATDKQGNVYAGGNFRNTNQGYYLAKWDGNTWSELGTGANALNANNAIATISVKSNNEIYAAGYFSEGAGTQYVAKWNGTSWSTINNSQDLLLANNSIFTIQVNASKNVFAGGDFTNKSGHQYVAEWNGNAWSETGGKGDPFYFNSADLYEMEADTLGNLYVSGYTYNNGESRFLEHWDSHSWKEVPINQSDLSVFLYGNPFNPGKNMAIDRTGNLYVTGRNTTYSIAYDCVLKWDGKMWSRLEDTVNALYTYNSNPVYNSIKDIETDAQGNVYVVGNFNPGVLHNMAKWDGKKWSYLPEPFGNIEKITIGTNRKLYAFGYFSSNTDNYNVGELMDNGEWEEVKNGDSKFHLPVNTAFLSMALDSANNIYVNGEFNDSAGNQYLQKWDGEKWSTFGTSNAISYFLAVGKNNIYSAGNTLYTNDCRVKQWNGNTWVGVGAPLDDKGIYPLGQILGTDAKGNVYTDANLIDGSVSTFIAKFSATTSQPPKLLSFTPQEGSLNSTITITGKNLLHTATVSFGGINASSVNIISDSVITAVVGSGASGNVRVQTLSGADSTGTFTYTCDSVKGTVPYISLDNDSVLTSSYADYYQWFFNNNALTGKTSNTLIIHDAGFYHVETSTNKICWLPSLDYPVLVSNNPLPDSLKMMIYPNPSTGKFTAEVKLPNTTTVKAYIKVYDANGNQVLETNKLIFYGNEIKIPVTINSKGTYFVKVFVNNNTVQKTVIIM